jgi:hypothetical protein
MNTDILSPREWQERLEEYEKSDLFARDCASNMSADHNPPEAASKAVIDAYGPETLADAEHEPFLLARPWRINQPTMLAEVIELRRCHPSTGGVA